jgi:fatty-acyl-CoA synthase
MISHSTSGTPLLGESIGELLVRRSRSRPADVAIVWSHGERLKSMTYGELAGAANGAAHRLAHLALGERVAVWGRNCVEWVLLEYACALRGLVLAPLNTAWTDAEALAAIELVEPAVLFAGDDGRGEHLGARGEVLMGSGQVYSLDVLRGRTDAPQIARTVAADQPFLVQFTSGTTGRSKGAVLSHRAALNSAYLRARRDWGSKVCLNSVPFHHVGGSVFVILGALSVGGSFVVVDRFRPDESVRLLSAVGVTHLGGVPIMVEQILDELTQSESNASELRTVALGGASISPALVQRVRVRTGASVMVTYGQSECPLVTNSAHDDPPDKIAYTSGRPCEATDVRITDPETGRTVPTGHTGEIQVRSPMMMSGYYGMPEATQDAFTSDGFLRTGDLGCVDSDGYLSIRDRVRDVIIRGGENVYPAEVEAALADHPDVAACAVVGVADPRWGECVAARVVRSGKRVDPAELEQFLAARLAHFKIPRIWQFVDALPLTASGKIRRNIVRAEMNTTHLSGPPS